MEYDSEKIDQVVLENLWVKGGCKGWNAFI
jgi:hypothetical protein